MRLHRNLVYTNDSLNAYLTRRIWIKWLQEPLKKDKRWGSSDRKFVAETIYEVRWKRLYAEIVK
jgi:16S rRNA (cytosine967-C5)-methyltransferase